MSTKASIKDTRVRIKPSAALCAYIVALHDVTEMPANVRTIYQLFGGTAGESIGVLNDVELNKPAITNADLAFLKQLNDEQAASEGTGISLADILTISGDDSEANADDDADSDVEDVEEVGSGKALSKTRAKRLKEQRKERQKARVFLTLQDLLWLNALLVKRRAENNVAATKDDGEDNEPSVYLHQLLAGSRLLLPRNEVHERDPVLEARCVRLRLEQDARVYKSMTKNVDTSRRLMPDDSIAFQMKAINRHMIAVAQFLFSVAAGFAFGFIGVELLIGNLDFGFRLLLGIICALVIALAEIYFLAKQLNEEYDITVAEDKVVLKGSPIDAGKTKPKALPADGAAKKPHAD